MAAPPISDFTIRACAREFIIRMDGADEPDGRCACLQIIGQLPCRVSSLKVEGQDPLIFQLAYKIIAGVNKAWTEESYLSSKD